MAGCSRCRVPRWVWVWGGRLPKPVQARLNKAARGKGKGKKKKKRRREKKAKKKTRACFGLSGLLRYTTPNSKIQNMHPDIAPPHPHTLTHSHQNWVQYGILLRIFLR